MATWKVAYGSIDENRVADNARRVRHHQGHAEQPGQGAAAESERDAAECDCNVVRIGLELTNAGIEVGDAASKRELRE